MPEPGRTVRFNAMDSVLGISAALRVGFGMWTRDISRMVPVAMGIALGGSAVGLLLSYHAALPAGPAIVLTLGALYLASLLAGRDGLLLRSLRRRWHYTS